MKEKSYGKTKHIDDKHVGIIADLSTSALSVVHIEYMYEKRYSIIQTISNQSLPKSFTSLKYIIDNNRYAYLEGTGPPGCIFMFKEQ